MKKVSNTPSVMRFKKQQYSKCQRSKCFQLIRIYLISFYRLFFPVSNTRTGWEQAAKEAHEAGDDKLIQ
jgi:hypothetical protein